MKQKNILPWIILIIVIILNIFISIAIVDGFIINEIKESNKHCIETVPNIPPSPYSKGC